MPGQFSYIRKCIDKCFVIVLLCFISLHSLVVMGFLEQHYENMQYTEIFFQKKNMKISVEKF